MKSSPMRERGLIYQPHFVSPQRKKLILEELKQLHPIWEDRYSISNPPPQGQANRRLLRPVYWLGNWQFACLNYYHPPKGIEFRCVEAEPYPPEMHRMVLEIEEIIRNQIEERDIPRHWHFNTCLINYYGSQIENGKKVDVARVGEHKDFEPGPVASISFGDKALFQFVTSAHKQAQSQVVRQMWLEDSSLQIFAGEKYKKKLFHRVQRVERKTQEIFDLNTPDFETRRLNFTFRYVPDEHIRSFRSFPPHLQADIQTYVETLARHSDFFRDSLSSILV